MVFLALTRAGLAEALALAGGSPVWCCAAAITEEEFAARHLPNLTRFAFELGSSGTQFHIDQALADIEEHHPNERIWVEHLRTV